MVAMKDHSPLKHSKKYLMVLLFLISTGILSLSFYRNQWGIADQAWFQNFQRDSESYILGRLVKSRQDGIFSSSGLTGKGNGLSVEGQYQAYLHQDQFLDYEPYKSQIGLQGMFFSYLDKISPFESEQNLRVFYVLTALLTGLVLSAVLLWFSTELGLFAASFVFISTLLSRWILVFGRNLWWSTWAFYLPMVICMFLLASEEESKNSKSWTLSVFISLGVFMKCLVSGYEFMTTTLVMLAVPILYYGIRRGWKRKLILKRLFYVQFGALFSIFMSLAILTFQLSSIEGSYLNGGKYILNALGERTHGNLASDRQIIQESLEAEVLPVVSQYTQQVMVDLNNLIHVDQKWLIDAFSIRFIDVCLFLLLSTLLGFGLIRMKSLSSRNKKKITALIAGTWFAILAPLSWFVVFKAHSYIHTHMNSITWHMPFTLFGFALTGYVVRIFLIEIRKKMAPS